MSSPSVPADNTAIPTAASAIKQLSDRLVTMLVLCVIAGLTIYIGSWLLAALLLGVAVLMDLEWHRLRPKGLFWWLFGIAYITLPILSALALRDLSMMALIYPVALVIATDLGGYIFGKSIGGPKLAPAISPGKTWSGLLGAATFASITSLLFMTHVPWPQSPMMGIGMGIIAALLAQSGDLFESWLKRRKGVKDSGNLLPGHGGVLDRVDGYVLVLPAYLLALIIWAEVSA